MPRKVDEAALARAVRVAGGAPSLVRREIEAYLEGLAATQYAKNPRICALASMKVGDSKLRIWGQDEPMVRYLPSADKRRARILMENPGADWSSTPVDFGIRITRIA